MAITADLIRRVLLTCGLAVATVATPVIVGAVTPAPGTAVAQCSSGEENDVFTSTCTPFLTPNTTGFTATAANPDVPEVDGVPCVGGRSSGACFGLLEDQQAAGPPVEPRTTISSSP
jgi:hypothetical protein